MGGDADGQWWVASSGSEILGGTLDAVQVILDLQTLSLLEVSYLGKKQDKDHFITEQFIAYFATVFHISQSSIR